MSLSNSHTPVHESTSNLSTVDENFLSFRTYVNGLDDWDARFGGQLPILAPKSWPCDQIIEASPLSTLSYLSHIPTLTLKL